MRRSCRQPGALPCEIRLSEQQRRSCECVNVWRELGSGERGEGERRAEPEDRAGIKRAIGKSNRECVFVCAAVVLLECFLVSWKGYFSGPYYHYVWRIVRGCFSLIRRIKLNSIRAREHLVYATSYLSSTLVP